MDASETARTLLDDNTVLVEYKVCDSRSYAWIITPHEVYSAELPGRDQIRALVGRLSVARDAPDTVGADQIYWNAARDLSDAVIAPVAEKLRAKRMYLVTDDVLQEVSFAGLPWPAGSRNQKPVPLVERFEVTSIPSASTLAAMRDLHRPDPAPKAIAIFADPVFAPDDERIVPSGENAGLSVGTRPRLKASGAEAAKIARLVPADQTAVFTGAGANRTAFENSHLEDFRHILLATHAVVDTRRPDLSGIVLSEFDAEGSPQDGIVRLLSVYGMRLRADLVVLSTCESAEGKNAPGEGLLALSRGFLYAGSRAVMATLWQVRDPAAARLVSDAYTRMFGPQKARGSAALRNTQLALWREGQSPRKWAAFVMIGDAN